jgi:hypothetical protein
VAQALIGLIENGYGCRVAEQLRDEFRAQRLNGADTRRARGANGDLDPMQMARSLATRNLSRVHSGHSGLSQRLSAPTCSMCERASRHRSGHSAKILALELQNPAVKVRWHVRVRGIIRLCANDRPRPSLSSEM